MKTLLLLALCVPLQAASLDDYYKFKAGTTWSYKRVENGAERKITGRVTGEEGGKVSLEWKDFEKDGSLKESIVVTWSVVDGLLTASAHSEAGQEVLSFAVLKADSKKGDKWTGALGEVVHQGTVEVTVPAGTYKNAVKTQLAIGEGGAEAKIDFYMVPKVGLVKLEIVGAGEGGNTFELTEFKEAKK